MSNTFQIVLYSLSSRLSCIRIRLSVWSPKLYNHTTVCVLCSCSFPVSQKWMKKYTVSAAGWVWVSFCNGRLCQLHSTPLKSSRLFPNGLRGESSLASPLSKLFLCRKCQSPKHKYTAPQIRLYSTPNILPRVHHVPV